MCPSRTTSHFIHFAMMWRCSMETAEREFGKIARLCDALNARAPRYRGTSVSYPIRVGARCRFDAFLGPTTPSNPIPHSIDGKFPIEDIANVMVMSKFIEEIFSPVCGSIFPSYDTWYDAASDYKPDVSFYDPATHVIPWDTKRRLRGHVLQYTSLEARRIISNYDGFDWNRAHELGLIDAPNCSGWMKLHEFTGDKEIELVRRKAVFAYCRHLTDEIPEMSPLPIRLTNASGAS
jgi:hypothetical protein